MSALLESLQLAFADAAQSKTALDQAVAIGFPGPRTEQWKYTSLRPLSARRFVAPPSALAELNAATLETLASIPGPRIVFINGNYAPDHSSLADLPNGVTFESSGTANADDDSRFASAHDIFAKLNTAIAKQGMQIHVDDSFVPEKCLQVIFVSVGTGTDLAIHYRHKITLGKNAKLALIEHHVSQDSQQHLINTLCDIALQDGAEFSHARIQQDNAGNSHFLRTEASLQSLSVYRRLDLELGAHVSRHDLQVKLLGDGAALYANGSLIASGRRHVDTRLDIQHIAKNTSCNLLWRGLATERGRAVFHGGILIEKGADGTAAHLSNKNLLLSDNAEIDTQPVLVIHADEVTASHGATVGRLDDGHLFYLRARGIPEAQAKAMLTNAFCKQTLQVLGNEDLIAQVAPSLEKALQIIEVQA